MRISSKLVEAISADIIKTLLERKIIKPDSYQMIQEKITSIMVNDLTIEDRLDEEVRSIMEEHQEMIRRSNVEYHEMFKQIKKKLAKERKLIL